MQWSQKAYEVVGKGCYKWGAKRHAQIQEDIPMLGKTFFTVISALSLLLPAVSLAQAEQRPGQQQTQQSQSRPSQGQQQQAIITADVQVVPQ
jgi:hypothetical protein